MTEETERELLKTVTRIGVQVEAAREDITGIGKRLDDAMSQGSADRQQLNVRLARVEEQVRVGRWVLGTIGAAAVASVVMGLMQLLGA